MIIYQIIEDEDIVVIAPKGRVTQDDLRNLIKDVDLHLARTGRLHGVLILAAEFPEWETIGMMVTHLRFVRNYHRVVKKVALASNSTLPTIMPKLVDHFVNAEVKGFAFDEKEKAMAWLKRPD